ncbi:MAG: primosomal protein N' [Holosporaceae bacterium]|jgi:primosomal protein N' (replication factor Y)|nr:primosomal protein N' [Holosporaceae bacterium]
MSNNSESIVSVLPEGPFDSSFSYLCGGAAVVPGDVVEVPFGKRTLLGVVTDQPVETNVKLKNIAKVFNHNIGDVSLKFLQWVSDYTLVPRGNVLKMILAEKSVFSAKKNITMPGKEIFRFQDIELNDDQRIAMENLRDSGSRPFLLHGVTGSGKTEVYLTAVREVLQANRQALILFPEIALTNQIIQRIQQYFGITPTIWNSQVSSKNKRIAWHGAISGETHVFVGARSALFLPFKNLGIIVVDEEHDSSYKQEEGSFYNARDMAIVLGHLRHVPVILSSATPSLESYLNTKNGKYGYVFIKNRFGKSVMPSLKLIDMRQNKFDGFISPPLLAAVESTLERGEQCLIYLNRRGYSPVTLCKSCGEKIECPNCTSWLVYHRSTDKMTCHHCGHRTQIPQKCPACGEKGSMIPFGPGVERVFDELKNKLPKARIAIGSSDTISSSESIAELFRKLYNNEIDIIIGTQILAKGHHFPNITLVGVVDGDLGLHGADIRASERTYQLINQVSGRAGRAEKMGKILIQTFNPSHSLYVALKSPDPRNFMELELASRQEADLPPFSRFAAIIISGTNRELTEKVAKDLADVSIADVRLFGPAPAPFFLLRGRVRWRILLKAPKKIAINNLIKKWVCSKKTPKNVKIQIDIDPISFL